MKKTRAVLLSIAACALVASCTASSTEAPSTTSATTHTHSGNEPTSTQAPRTTTTTAATTTTAEPPSFVTTGNEVRIHQSANPTHIVVLLHGLGAGPSSVGDLAEHLSADGALVVAPKIRLTSSTASMGAPRSETACAVWFAHNLDPSLPIVIVGFSGGGLAAGQYIADPERAAQTDLCATPYEPTQVAGAVILDGPVWLEGYCATTGFCDPDDPAMPQFDPVAYAAPQPLLKMEYFFSDDIADYPEQAAAMLDEALGIESPTTRSDVTHTGLLRQEFYDRYAVAVRTIVAG